MKKQSTLKALLVMFVMAIFTISIMPATFAEDVSRDLDSGNKIVQTSKQQLKDNVQADQEAFKQKVQADKEVLKQKIEEKRNSPEVKARVEKAKEVLQASPEKRAEKIKQMAGEDFREFQKKQLMIAVDKCKENPNIDQAKCQEKLENRVALIDKLTQKDVEKLKEIGERKAEKQKDIEALKKEVAFAKYKQGEAVKAREIAKEKLQEKKDKYNEAKEKFNQLKDQEKEKNQLMVQAREEMRTACKADAASTACTEAKAKVLVHAKEVLLKQAGQMLESIEKIRSKVESSEDLSAEEAQKTIAILDTTKAMIESAKGKIDASTTQEELIDAAKALKAAWRDAKPNLKVESTKVVNARIGGIVVQSKQLQVKLERVMAKMTENGADTTKVQPLVDKFNTNIESAKNSYKLAVDAYLSKDQESAAASAQTYLNDAHKSLQDARVVLSDITKELRAQNSTALLNEDSDDAEDAAETTPATAEEVAAADAAQVAVEAAASS